MSSSGEPPPKIYLDFTASPSPIKTGLANLDDLKISPSLG
jgi:hypothetical protein